MVDFEHHNYTVMEGDSVEVCLINVTDVVLVHEVSVWIITNSDCDNNTVDATGSMRVYSHCSSFL